MRNVLVIALLASACGSFPTRTDDYECERTSDCPSGRVCESGWCVGGSSECDRCDDQEPCTIDSCEPGGGCTHRAAEDGTPCGGEGTCLRAATCQGGECQGEPVTDGTSCDDGLYCTEGDQCDGDGHCDGRPRVCSFGGDACNSGACDEDLDRCEEGPSPDYTACDDGEVCTANDVCIGGACGGVATGGELCGCDNSCQSCDGGCCSVNWFGGCDGPCPIDCTAADCSCSYTCNDTGCEGTCEQDCNVLCTSGAQCDLACDNGSLCMLDCRNADQCQMDCGGSAHCLLHCSDTDGCDPGDCDGGWSSCGDGVFACNRPCP